MKLNRQIILALVIMVAMSALYRIMPSRPMGFAPQIAIALFSGSLFASKKSYSFLLPIVSMLISDILYQVLYNFGYTAIQGFYSGQIENYILIDNLGRQVLSGKISSINTVVEVRNLSKGIYQLNIDDVKKQNFKLIKQ